MSKGKAKVYLYTRVSTYTCSDNGRTYAGKIAYGRRRTENVHKSKRSGENDYLQYRTYFRIIITEVNVCAIFKLTRQ